MNNSLIDIFENNFSEEKKTIMDISKDDEGNPISNIGQKAFHFDEIIKKMMSMKIINNQWATPDAVLINGEKSIIFVEFKNRSLTHAKRQTVYCKKNSSNCETFACDSTLQKEMDYKVDLQNKKMKNNVRIKVLEGWLGLIEILLNNKIVKDKNEILGFKMKFILVYSSEKNNAESTNSDHRGRCPHGKDIYSIKRYEKNLYDEIIYYNSDYFNKNFNDIILC